MYISVEYCVRDNKMKLRFKLFSDWIDRKCSEKQTYKRLKAILVRRGSAENLKGWVQCFSMQVVMNKCFLLNPERFLAQIRVVVLDKNAKIAHFSFEK